MDLGNLKTKRKHPNNNYSKIKKIPKNEKKHSINCRII